MDKSKVKTISKQEFMALSDEEKYDLLLKSRDMIGSLEGKRLTMAQRRELCMPHAKSAAGVVAKHEYRVPGYVTLYDFLKELDLDDFGRKLSAWMAAEDGTLPRQLALDGKFVKDVMGVVSVG